MSDNYKNHRGFNNYQRVLELCILQNDNSKNVCENNDLDYELLVEFLITYPKLNEPLEIYNYNLDIVDIENIAERALIYALTPHIVKTTKIERVTSAGSEGEIETIKTTVSEKHISPDAGLIKFALERLNKAKYGDGDKDENSILIQSSGWKLGF